MTLEKGFVGDTINTLWPQYSLALLRDGTRTYRLQFHIHKPTIQPPPSGSALNADPTQSTMSARTSPRHDWRSEDQHVSQNITEKMIRTVRVSSTRLVGNTISIVVVHKLTKDVFAHLNQ